MKNSIKKLLSLTVCLLLAFASIFTLVGCGGGGGYQEVDDVQRDENGKIKFNDTKITVWSIIGDPDNVYLEKVNTMFNDYYKTEGIQATVKSIANADFYTQLANTITTDPDNAPDMVIIHSERLNRLAADKVLVPIADRYYELAGESFSADDYLSNVMAECYYKNEMYGVPLDVHAGVWFVREDILAKNGLTKPTNLDEFVAVCNKLIELNNQNKLWYRSMSLQADQAQWKQGKLDNFYPVVMSSTGGIENGWIPQTAVFQNGGKLTDENGKPAWNTDGLQQVMQMFRNWQTGEGNYKGTNYQGKFVGPNGSSQTVWSDLSSARAVFSCEGPWWIEQRFDGYEEILSDTTNTVTGEVVKPLGIMNMSNMYALDQTKDYADKVYGVGHCFSICKTVTSTTKRVACALYAKYMTQNAVDYMQGGHLPAANAILNSKEYTSKDFYTRYLKDMGDPADFIMLGNTEYYTPVYEGIKKVYIDVLDGNKAAISVQELITARFEESMRQISSSADL